MDAVIKNAVDLKFEITRLKQKAEDQETVIKQHFNSPRAILGTVSSLFSKSKTEQVLDNPGLLGKDFIGVLSKLLLPLTLNKTLFKRSNFVVKALVGLLSQKASKFINDKSVASLLEKIRAALPDAVAEKVFPPKRRSFGSILSRAKTNTVKLIK